MRKLLFVILFATFPFATWGQETSPELRAMMACNLVEQGDIDEFFASPLPNRPNLTLLLSGNTDQLEQHPDQDFPVSETSDIDGLLGGSEFSSIRLKANGHYSAWSTLGERNFFILSLVPLGPNMFQAALGSRETDGTPTHLGFCGFVENERAKIDDMFASLENSSLDQ